MSSQPTAFSDIPRDHFPFTIEMIDLSGRVVWSETIHGPGAVRIPGLAHRHGPVATRIRFANGEEVYEPAPKM